MAIDYDLTQHLIKAFRRLADPAHMAGMGDVKDPEGLQRIAYAKQVLADVTGDNSSIRYLGQSSPKDPTGALTNPYVMSTQVLRALHEAGVLPEFPMMSRVVIDLQAGQVARMYVDRIPTGALLTIAPLMTDAAKTGA